MDPLLAQEPFPPGVFEDALRGERVKFLAVAHNVRRDLTRENALHQLNPYWLVLNADLLAGLEVLEDAIATAELPLDEHAAACDASLERLASMPGWYRLSRMFLPICFHEPRHVLEHARTERAAARLGLAARLHLDTNGRWPASLDDLEVSFPSGLPVQPTDANPFSLRIRGSNLLIVSPYLQERRGVDEVGRWHLRLPRD